MNNAAFSIGSAAFGSTRHPFRASLPRRVLRSLPEFEPEVTARMAAVAAADAAVGDAAGAVVTNVQRRGWSITTQDVKDFLMAYTACLLAVLAFLG